MQRTVSSGGAAGAAGADAPESLRPTTEDIALLLASGFLVIGFEVSQSICLISVQAVN
jgi:hypothetical protein